MVRPIVPKLLAEWGTSETVRWCLSMNSLTSSVNAIVYDLPQLHTKPTGKALLEGLDLLRRSASSFDNISTPDENGPSAGFSVDQAGVPRYLTSIVSSALAWLDADDQEAVWEAASLRLSERSGRNAAPALKRSFTINDCTTITLHEPSLTEDNLGFKTWTSSLLLSRRLAYLSQFIPAGKPRVLELGSGTGLVGIAASHVWRSSISEVQLTDLPAIVPNLEHNVRLNSDSQIDLKDGYNPVLSCRVLDWAETEHKPTSEGDRFPLIIAADPIYSPEHPRLLIETVERWIGIGQDSCFILELPLRESYVTERTDLKTRLEKFMELVDEGNEVGYDDWEDADGQPVKVECWWSVWKLKAG